MYLIRIGTQLHEVGRHIASFADYLSWLVLDLSKFERKKGEISSLLIVIVNDEMGNVGGDVCTLGVISFFEKVYPNIKVSYLLDDPTRKLLRPKSEVLEYRGRGDLEKVRKLRPDAVLIFNLGRGLSIKDFEFIPRRVIRSDTSVGTLWNLKNKFGYTHKVWIPWGMHMVETRFKMLESLGFSFKKKKVLFQSYPDEKKFVDSFLKKNRIRKFVVIHPGGKHVVETLKRGGWPPHLWSLEKYSKVCDALIDKGYKIIVTGTKSEEVLCKEIKKHAKRDREIISGCGVFSFRQAGEVLSRANCLIATDTSIVHLAYQVGVPIVALFGPSCPEVVGPWPIKDKKYRVLIDKGPCYRSMKKIESPEGIKCLDQISVEEVVNSTKEIIR